MNQGRSKCGGSDCLLRNQELAKPPELHCAGVDRPFTGFVILRRTIAIIQLSFQTFYLTYLNANGGERILNNGHQILIGIQVRPAHFFYGSWKKNSKRHATFGYRIYIYI